MEFFNKKEEVIEVKLTQFGKKKYSEGTFRPKYYAFYDNDIVYDTSYAGYYEPAHSASIRIKDAPRLKIQSALIGIETDINKKIDKIRRTNGNISPENIQQVKEKSYRLTNALGRSDVAKDHAPAWDMRSYFSRIESNAATYDNSGKTNFITIPQINMQDLNYKIKPLNKPDFNANAFGHVFPDGTSLTVDDNDGEMLIGLSEVNSPLSNNKFEIEVFLVNEENGQENLVPLNFRKKKERIVNGVLLDDIGEENEPVDETYVEKYLDIEADLEIDPEVLRRALGNSATMTGMEEIRTFGLSGQFLLDDDFPATGLVGSEKAANLSPDDIAKLSGKSLKELGTSEEQTSAESIYNKVPPNSTTNVCEDEEE